jgi:addiction module HigA family antidote
MSRPPIHPGEILADEMDDIGRTTCALARRIDVPPNRISEIIRGWRGVTGDTAPCLGHWFGTTPHSGPTSRRPMTCAWRPSTRAKRSRDCPGGRIRPK